MDGESSVILVVEDEAFVGWDLCDMLESEGYATLGPAPSVDSAMKIIDGVRPSLALLDVNLGSATVWPVADRLAEMKVPIVFTTADLGHPELYTRFAGAPRLGKPVASEALLQTVAAQTAS